MTDYPHFPGWKDTLPSLEAAVKMSPKAETLRNKVYQALKTKSMTADETADLLGESILAIRPRFSELKKMRLIADSGARRRNASGCRATVWVAVPSRTDSKIERDAPSPQKSVPA